MNKLFEILFKKDIEAYEKAVDNILKKADSEIKKVEHEANLKSKQYDLINNAFEQFRNGKLIGLSENKDGEKVFVFEVLSNSSLNYYLFGESYVAINRHPRIMCTIYNGNYVKEPYIHIDDIIEVECNRGNASILMPYLIKEAKKLNVNCIDGWLSDVDQKHFDRSEHFYKKHGFEVKFNEDRTSGSIKLFLNK